MLCSIKDCNQPAKYKGLCGMHYKRQWRHGDTSISIIPHRLTKIKCYVEDCDNVISGSNGLCKLHDQRMRRYGRLENEIMPKGAGGIDYNGYYVITVDGKRVYEHIHKAEKALGKPLPKGAVVHHMNCIRHDNETPFNLVICPDQAYHLLLHRRMKELGIVF